MSEGITGARLGASLRYSLVARVQDGQTAPPLDPPRSGENDEVQISTRTGKNNRPAVPGVGEAVKFGSDSTPEDINPLGEDVRRLFAKDILADMKRLATKDRQGSLSEVERVKLNAYFAVSRVKNEFDFLHRILSGDLTTAADSARQKKYELQVSRAEVSDAGVITQNGSVIDPGYAVVIGETALVVRDGRNNLIPVGNLVLRHRDARDTVTGFAAGHLQSTSGKAISSSGFIFGSAQQYILQPLSPNARFTMDRAVPLEIRRLVGRRLTGIERDQLLGYKQIQGIRDRYEFLNRILAGDRATLVDEASQKEHGLSVHLARVSPDGEISLNGRTVDRRFAVVSDGWALVVRDGQDRLLAVEDLVRSRETAGERIEAFTRDYIKLIEAAQGDR